MALFNLISLITRKKRIADHAPRITQQSRQAVQRLVESRMDELSGPEMRGYIRARANLVVAQHVQAAIQQETDLQPADKDDLIHLVIEQLTDTITRKPQIQRTCLAA